MPKALFKPGREAVRKVCATPFYANQHDMVAAVMTFQNLGRQTLQHSRHFVLLKQQGSAHVSSRNVYLPKA